MAGEGRTARRFFEEILGTGDWSSASEILQADVVMYHPASPEPIEGLEAVQAFLSARRTGMPDLGVAVDGVAGEGERIAVRWHASGTHTGEMFGLTPTGNRIEVHGISFLRFEDGKIAEDWVEENTLSVLQQLGVVPALA
jgi:steroid delta-isomerase-like uncharacterized protein